MSCAPHGDEETTSLPETRRSARDGNRSGRGMVPPVPKRRAQHERTIVLSEPARDPQVVVVGDGRGRVPRLRGARSGGRADAADVGGRRDDRRKGPRRGQQRRPRLPGNSVRRLDRRRPAQMPPRGPDRGRCPDAFRTATRRRRCRRPGARSAQSCWLHAAQGEGARLVHGRRQRRPEACRDDVDSRRRLYLRLRVVARLRRRESGADRRRGGRLHQSPAGDQRASLSGRRRRRVRRLRQRRHAGHRRCAAVGARQRRELRRRSGQRDDLRPVGRRRQGQHAAGDAVCQGAVPQGDRGKRIDAEADDP